MSDIKRISINSSSIEDLAKIHNEFHIVLTSIVDSLISNFGDIWLSKSTTIGQEYKEKTVKAESLYKKVYFLVDNGQTESSISNKEAGLLHTYPVINTERGYAIIREISLYISPILLFPFILKSNDLDKEQVIGLNIRDKSNKGDCYGVDYIVNGLYGDFGERFIFSVDAIKEYQKEDKSLYRFVSFKLKNLEISDDIGKSFNKFTNNPHLSYTHLPSYVVDRQYTLIDTSSNAPETTNEEIDCILYAELDDKKNPQSIKVLRWFPKNKSLGKCTSHSVYSYGYIMHEEASSLHKEMCLVNNRFLFAKSIGKSLRIVGNLDCFLENGCYSAYWLPRNLFKYISD